jgi:hypothetical protein
VDELEAQIAGLCNEVLLLLQMEKEIEDEVPLNRIVAVQECDARAAK